MSVSATGDVAPPLLIINGQVFNRYFLYGSDISGAVVACTTNSFVEYFFCEIVVTLCFVSYL